LKKKQNFFDVIKNLEISLNNDFEIHDLFEVISEIVSALYRADGFDFWLAMSNRKLFWSILYLFKEYMYLKDAWHIYFDKESSLFAFLLLSEKIYKFPNSNSKKVFPFCETTMQEFAKSPQLNIFIADLKEEHIEKLKELDSKYNGAFQLFILHNSLNREKTKELWNLEKCFYVLIISSDFIVEKNWKKKFDQTLQKIFPLSPSFF